MAKKKKAKTSWSVLLCVGVYVANICLVSMFSICHAMCFVNMMRQNIPVINWAVQSVNASILHSRVFPSVPFHLCSNQGKMAAM